MLKITKILILLSLIYICSGCKDRQNPIVPNQDGISFEVKSGNNQTCFPGDTTSHLLVVEYLSDGEPLYDKQIRFKTIDGPGWTTAKINGMDEVLTITNYIGQAGVKFLAHPQATPSATATVRATVVEDASLTVTFKVTIK